MTIFSSATWGPVKTLGRYALTASGAAIATLSAVGLMSQGDAATATEAIKSIAESLGTIATSTAAIAGVAGAIYATVVGTKNSTPTSQIATVKAMEADPDSPVKGVILSATPAARELKQSLPGPGLVIEGTPAAQIAASTDPTRSTL